MSWHYHHGMSPLFLATLVAAGLAVVLWRRRRQQGAVPLLVLVVGAGIWAFGEAMEMGCRELPPILAWAKIRYLGIVSIPTAWLIFGIQFSRLRKLATPRIFLALSILPAVNLIMVWTDGWHHLIFREIWLHEQYGLTAMASERGPWYYVVVTTAYSYVLVGAVLLTRTALRSHRIFRRQTVLLIAAVLLPLVANLVFQLRLSPIPYIDPTPLTFSVVAFVLTWSFVRHGLLFLPMPVAKEQVLQSIHDGVLVLDLDRRVLDANNAALSMLNTAPESLVGRLITDFLALPPDESRTTTPRTMEIHVPAENPEASGRILEVSQSPLRKRWAGEVGSVLILRDVSEQKELRMMLQQSQKTEALGRLAGGIAHDFNNLLTPIMGYAEMLIETLEEGDDRKDDLERIIKVASRARGLTNKLLAVSRRQVLEFQPLDLNSTLFELLSILRRTTRENIEIIEEFAPDLNAVQGDVSQIEQVAMNLVINAQEAMPEGGELTIRTRPVLPEEVPFPPGKKASRDSYICFSVTDTGLGMSQHVQEHVFEPFFSTKPEGVNTGLGLATVYGIVDQHGGAVSIVSREGAGTTVSAFFPATDEPVPRAEEEHPREAAALKPAREAGKKEASPSRDEGVKPAVMAFLVEDDPAVRRMASVMLTRKGFKVVSFDEGAHCLEALSEGEHVPGLLVTDLIMPTMGGRELSERARVILPDLPVLFMSGHVDKSTAAEGLAGERNAFVQKPFTLSELETALQELSGGDEVGQH